MSLKLMSAIIETEFTVMKDGAGNVDREAQLVLVSSARRARDEREGSQ